MSAPPAAPASPRPEGSRVRRVLLVSYEYPPLGGGGGVMVRSLAEGMERQGALEIVRAPVWLRTANAVASLPSMLSFYPSSLRTGRALLAEEPVDVVHSVFAVPSGPSGLRLARGAGVPHVLSVIGGDIYDPSKRLSPHRTPLLKQTVRAVVHGSQRVVAESEDVAERTRSIYGAPRVALVPLGVELPRGAPAARSELGLPDDARVLVSVGRLVARKGLDDLVDALAELADPSLHLVIVGEGPLRESIESRARDAGLADRVHLPGFVSEERKAQLLEAADLYVSTTRHEGFGIVFIEAMACGLPVVTYDCGGQADFVSDAVGRLVPLGDRARFVASVRELVADPARRAALGAAAREQAQRYSVDAMVDRYLGIYDECLGEAPHP